jgi:hypothetical protein
MTLRDALVWLTTVGAGVVTFWLLDNITWLRDLGEEVKRYAAFILSAAIADLAWLGLLAMQYVPTPGPWPSAWRSWLEALFAIAAGAIITSQVLHARAKSVRAAKMANN